MALLARAGHVGKGCRRRRHRRLAGYVQLGVTTDAPAGGQM